jgi:outer membrane protein assembly factor BamB
MLVVPRPPSPGVYTGTANGTIVALRASDGKRLWSLATGTQPAFSSATVVKAALYEGSGANVYALNASTGKLRWTFPTGGFVDSSPGHPADGREARARRVHDRADHRRQLRRPGDRG